MAGGVSTVKGAFAQLQKSAAECRMAIDETQVRPTLRRKRIVRN